MSTEYKVTLGLRIYRACPNGIFFSEFIRQNSFSTQFLSNVRSGEVTLLASTKSGSLLSPPPPHTSEPFFSSSNPRDFQLLSPPPPRTSFASESFFSSPDNSDTLPLPLWAKCDTVISSWSANISLCTAQWDVCLGDDSSFVQSVRFFGSKVRPNGHYRPFFLFSQSSRLSWAQLIFDE